MRRALDRISLADLLQSEGRITQLLRSRLAEACTEWATELVTLTTLLKALGVGQSEYKGTMYWNRTTFVIDPTGRLRKIYENVKPEGHEQTLLTDIKAMQAS